MSFLGGEAVKRLNSGSAPNDTSVKNGAKHKYAWRRRNFLRAFHTVLLSCSPRNSVYFQRLDIARLWQTLYAPALWTRIHQENEFGALQMSRRRSETCMSVVGWLNRGETAAARRSTWPARPLGAARPFLIVLTFCGSLALANGLDAAAPVQTGLKITWLGANWNVTGVNMPWYNWGCDFGCNANGGVVQTQTPSAPGWRMCRAQACTSCDGGYSPATIPGRSRWTEAASPPASISRSTRTSTRRFSWRNSTDLLLNFVLFNSATRPDAQLDRQSDAPQRPGAGAGHSVRAIQEQSASHVVGDFQRAGVGYLGLTDFRGQCRGHGQGHRRRRPREL